MTDKAFNSILEITGFGGKDNTSYFSDFDSLATTVVKAFTQKLND